MATRRPVRHILGKKLRMTQVFTPEGDLVPVTVLEAGPCSVLQVKTPERDGYGALQVGFDDARKRPRKPQGAVYEKIGVPPKRFVREIPLLEGQEARPGEEIRVGVLKDVRRVDVWGVSKGRGFSGTVRRWGFTIGPKSHGCKNVREPGSVGMGADPARIIKGKKMAGRYGGVRCMVRNLEVVRVIEDENLLLVRGAVPGSSGSYLIIRESLKGA